MTYAKLLYEIPTDRLREIVRRRARTIRAVPRLAGKRQLCTFLAEALSAPGSVNEALANTDRLQLQVLMFAIIHGGAVTFDDLSARLGEKYRSQLWSAVTDLESLGLVVLTSIAVTAERIGGDKAVIVPSAVRAQTPLPLPLRRLLPSALDNYDSGVIETLYQTLGLPEEEGSSRSAQVRRISETLTNSDLVRSIVGELGQPAKSILDHVISLGGATNLSQLALRLETRQRNQLYSYDWAARWHHGKPRNPVEELLARGLLVLDGAVGWGYGSIVIPGNVLSAITGRPLFAASAAAMPEWETIPAEGAALHRHESLRRDIAYLMGFLARTDASRTSKGNIHRNTLKSVAKGLTIPTAEYAAFVYAVAREADLIGVRSQGAVYDVTEQGLSWLELSAEEQLRSLFDVWRVQTGWSENMEEPLTEGAPFYAFEETRAFREHSMTLLKSLWAEQPGRLASLRSFTARAQFKWWSLFAAAALEDRELEEERRSGDELVLQRLLCGSLYWLGITEVIEAGPNSMFVGLSRRGAAWMGLLEPAGEASSQTVDRFVLQPNLEIYAPPNLAPNLLYRLFKIAEPSSGAGALLTLTAETLRRAFDRGETGDSILELFRSHSQTGVPQNVEYLVNEIGGKHGHIHIGQAGIYLQVSDPMLLKEIKAQKRLNIHFRRQLTETVALVAGDSVDSILKQLRQAGYLPVSDEARHETTSAHHPPKTRYRSPIPAQNHSSPVEPKIDWDLIAEEDGLPWDDSAKPDVAIEKQTLTDAQKRSLLLRAAGAKLVLAIRYQPDPRVQVAEREIEPIGLAGSLLRAYDRSKGGPVLFNMRYITSVRETGQMFSE